MTDRPEVAEILARRLLGEHRIMGVALSTLVMQQNLSPDDEENLLDTLTQLLAEEIEDLTNWRSMDARLKGEFL